MVKMKLDKYAIIAGDVNLAEAVCSRLRKPGIYLPVFEAPQKRMMEYGFFENDCIQLGNAVRALEAKKILFLKVKTDIAEKLEEHFGRLVSVSLESPDEKVLARHFGANKKVIGLNALQASDTDYEGELFAVEDDLGIATVIAANLARLSGFERIKFVNTCKSMGGFSRSSLQNSCRRKALAG